ncbi:serine racemase VanT catalytic subunit [Vallitalea sediminicola]
MNRREYAGIDYFRIIAAVLIVAIHTSPLLMINETANFILTRSIARVAVPFFFMTSGFFLFSNSNLNKERLNRFLKKTALLYLVSIVIYLPINIYNGYFKQDFLFLTILKDIFFDGTIYHLWYLPASMLGAVISFYLIKKIGCYKALKLTLLLYGIGLMGDSYFGIIESSRILNIFYKKLFLLSSYTRNGLFFAPVFFILGGIIARQRRQYSLKLCLVGTLGSTILMIVEGLLLNSLGLQRHDSMYIMLIPCMFFLYQLLILWKGHSLPILRNTAMIIYIIHPMTIVIIRLIGKSMNLQKILADNNLIHYIVVLVCSSIVAVVLARTLKKTINLIRYQKIIKNKDRAWIEVSLDNLKHNIMTLQGIIPDKSEIMAVVKADAYGHGAVKVASYLNEIGIKSFAVATIDEGILLRRKGIKGDILILGYTDPSRVRHLRRYRLTQTIIDYEYAKRLNEYKHPIKVHIKIDTGMHRMGENASKVDKIIKIFQFENLEIFGIYTHLCVADSKDREDIIFTKSQIESFYSLLGNLEKNNIVLPKVHIQSSYGLLNYPELHCDYVRLGIAIYGAIDSVRDKTKIQPDLYPVLSLKTKVALIREIVAGESVSYGRTFIADKNCRIAVIPIGYADGFPRNLSCECCSVLLHGYRVPIIGKICMDQLIIDITNVPDVKQGDIVTLIGVDGIEKIYATEVANKSKSIANEILSRLSYRVKKIYI